MVQQCLTTDLWRSGQNIEYMCITSHFIDVESWEMQKRMLYFQAVDLPITGNDIGILVQDELLNWGIGDKVIGITCDNASYYNNTFTYLASSFALSPLHEDIYRIRCCSHVLNLVILADLDHMKPLLNNIRYCVKHIRASTKRRSGWKTTCEQLGMPHRALLLETENRWNTTFHMLTRALKYKKVITRYMSTFTPHHALPDMEEWKQLRKFRDFLQPFYNATIVFCQIYRPTSTQVVRQLPYIVQAFKDYPLNVPDYVERYGPMVEDMKAKFKKYWDPLPLLYGIAALFDPSYKQKVLENILIYVYGDVAGKSQLTIILAKTKELFIVYSEMYGSDSQTVYASTSVGTSSSQICHDRLSCLFTPSGPTQSTTTELQRYLDERIEDNSNDFDILKFWKLQSDIYPILTAMAHDLLSAQVSSVASEQAFSTSKRVITDHCCSLTPESIEVYMCRNDWLRARNRTQEDVSTLKLIEDIQAMTLGDMNEFEDNEELDDEV